MYPACIQNIGKANQILVVSFVYFACRMDAITTFMIEDGVDHPVIAQDTNVLNRMLLDRRQKERKGFESSTHLKGQVQTCDSEGSPVFPERIKNIDCFICFCKNGVVECERLACPNEEGCFMLQNESSDARGCCKKCRGCSYQGKFYESGTEWSDPDDPCLVMTCKAGVVTESSVKCYTPCDDPVEPRKGECCPRCPGCRINGKVFGLDRNMTLQEDPCLKCTCRNGMMTCSKNACPVLHCPESNIEHRPGECCPRCKGRRSLMAPPKGHCLLNNIRTEGMTVLQDKCTFCSCVNSTSVCRRETCPPLSCPIERQFFAQHNSCCPQCPAQYENKTICQIGDKIYRDDESWQVNECKSCTCSRGQTHCTIEECSQSNNTRCPPNMRLYREPGTCCPRCVEEDGVCTVFGDPHYRTFDNKFFSFQGLCKYQLTADCVGQTFSIRVTNDGRSSKTSSWTKNVSIRMDKMKINLGHRMRVKVNGLRVPVPYVKENFAVITKISDSVMVTTYLGVKVVWDGDSFLEVSVPTEYKGRLCGLCGNYNSISKDDFTTRDGRLVFDSASFATSWQVGGKKACQRREPHRRIPCSRLPHRKMRDRLCKPLRSKIFTACHEKLNPDIYFKSCLVDMCECPHRKCYCQSLTAYAHECQRLGILLPDWRKLSGCPVNISKHTDD